MIKKRIIYVLIGLIILLVYSFFSFPYYEKDSNNSEAACVRFSLCAGAGCCGLQVDSVDTGAGTLGLCQHNS